MILEGDSQMFNEKRFQAACGLAAEQDDMTFVVSTDDVRKFLEERLITVVNQLRNFPEGKPKYSFPNDIKLRLYGVSAGKNFIPFIVMLPSALLESEAIQGRRQRDDHVLSVYTPNEEDGTQNMVYQVYQFFKTVMYTKEDMKGFNSAQMRQALGATSGTLAIFKKFMHPSVRSFGKDNGKDRQIMFMVDPIRVLHEMFKDNNNRGEQFRINVKGFKKILDGSYQFTVERKSIKGNTTKQDFAKELNKIMRG